MHSTVRMGQVSNPIRVAFGTFEADLSTGELWRGLPDKIQAQPFRILAELVHRPGQVVTREELQERVWEKGTNVDFDHSLGAAINKIREALGDNADNPRFVKNTDPQGLQVHRSGYHIGFPAGGSGCVDSERYDSSRSSRGATGATPCSL